MPTNAEMLAEVRVGDIISISGRQGLFRVLDIEMREYPRWERDYQRAETAWERWAKIQQISWGPKRHYTLLKRPGKIQNRRAQWLTKVSINDIMQIQQEVAENLNAIINLAHAVQQRALGEP